MSSDLFQTLIRASRSSAVRLRVRSALNPMLWLCAIGVPSCFGFGVFFDGWLRTMVVLAGVGLLAIAATAFLGLLIVAPDKLQSEEYQLRRRALDLIEERGTKIKMNPVSIEDIVVNPPLAAQRESSEKER